MPNEISFRTRRKAAVCLVVAASMFLGACHSSDAAAEKNLARFHDDVTRIQADHERLEERLHSLESKLEAEGGGAAKGSGGEAAPADGEGAGRRRETRKFPAGAGGREAVASDGSDWATDDGTPRPSIRIVGGKQGKGDGRRRGGAGDHIEQTLPDDGEEAATQGGPRAKAAEGAQGQSAFGAAQALMKARKYDEALESLAAFLVRYPDHPSAPLAQFGRGECYFAKGEFSRAADELQTYLERYPSSAKTSDALLMLGQSQSKLGMTTKARSTFERLAREYPRSDAARKIPREETP